MDEPAVPRSPAPRSPAPNPRDPDTRGDSRALEPSQWRRALEARVPVKALRDLANRLRHGDRAPLSDECLWADPVGIRFAYVPDPGRAAPRFRREASGMVADGDWDLSRRPLDEDVKSASIRLHFEQGVDWVDTPIVQKLLGEIADGRRPDGLRNRADVLARYAKIDRLHEEMRRSGRLRPRRELPDFFRREHGGIMVHVARDGTLLRAGGGQHRFALARLLRLPAIPLQVGVVHVQAVRSGHLAALRQPPPPA